MPRITAGAIVCAGVLVGVILALAWPNSPHSQGHPFRLVADSLGMALPKIVWRDGSARPLLLHDYFDAAIRSPDGRSAALGGDSPDGGLQFLDLVHRRLSFRAPVVGWPPEGCGTEPLLWSRSDRVVALGVCSDAHRTGASVLAVIDARRRKRIKFVPIGNVVREVRASSGVILLASPPLGPIEDHSYARVERLGPAQLIRVGTDASIRQVTLRVRAGYANSRTFNRLPGLAIKKNTAIVVSEDDGVAVIDLRSLTVAYHQVVFPPQPRWLASFHAHMGTDNPSRDLERDASWIDRKHVAVVGYDNWTSRRGDQTLPAGLRILDIRSWRVRLVDREAQQVQSVSGVVLSWGPSPRGLRAYDAAGRLLFRALSHDEVAFQRTRGREAFFTAWRGSARPRTYAITIPSGRTRPLQ